MKKKIISIWQQLVSITKTEYNDTLVMFRTIFKVKKTAEDKKKIFGQLKDLCILVAMIPFLILPGGTIALIVLAKVADYFKINIKVEKTF